MPATAALNPRPSIPRCRRPYLLGDKQGGLSGGGAGGQGGLPGVLLRVASVESGAWGVRFRLFRDTLADLGANTSQSESVRVTRVHWLFLPFCSIVAPPCFLFALEQCSRQCSRQTCPS
eukprot:COSAG06_NODE_22241_length_730_cov_0.740095_1_plen_118_part_10